MSVSGVKKYIYSVKVNWLANIQYRFNAISNILLWNLSLFATFTFWIVAFQGRDVINGYTLKDMLTFLLIVKVVASFSFHFLCYELGTLIKNGGLTTLLLKPQNIFLYLYTRTAGSKLVEFLSYFILLGLFAPVLHYFIIWQINLVYLLLFFVSILVGSIISYLIGILIGVFAFWLNEIFAVIWSLLVLINFLTGQFVPLDFFPEQLRRIVEFLPFSAFGYFPTKVYLAHYTVSQIFVQLLIYLGWIVVLSLSIWVLWRKGLKKYESVGA